MKCPKCHRELKKGKSRKFETLCDHACNSNQEDYPMRPTFVCKNKECPASKEDLFWDDEGAFYGWNENFKFDNDLCAAYPSIERKLEIEIYKKGQKSKLFLHPCLMLWFLQPMIEYTYKADDYGNVIKRGYKLIWLKKENWRPWVKERFGYTMHYSFPVMNIIRHIGRRVSTLKNCSDTYKQSEAKDFLTPLATWDKRWWRKVETWLDKNIFYKLYTKKE